MLSTEEDSKSLINAVNKSLMLSTKDNRVQLIFFVKEMLKEINDWKSRSQLATVVYKHCVRPVKTKVKYKNTTYFVLDSSTKQEGMVDIPTDSFCYLYIDRGCIVNMMYRKTNFLISFFERLHTL